MISRGTARSAARSSLKNQVIKGFAFVDIEKGQNDSPKGNYRPEFRPDNGRYFGFDHLKYYCSNSAQSAQHFTSRFGFDFEAYSGLETGNRDFSAHVVRNGDVRLVFQSALMPGNEEIGQFVTRHGDTVQDIAFSVEDVDKIFETAVSRGVTGISEPQTLEDEHGQVRVATLLGFEDTVHTLVDRTQYKGIFLPGYAKHHK